GPRGLLLNSVLQLLQAHSPAEQRLAARDVMCAVGRDQLPSALLLMTGPSAEAIARLLARDVEKAVEIVRQEHCARSVRTDVLDLGLGALRMLPARAGAPGPITALVVALRRLCARASSGHAASVLAEILRVGDDLRAPAARDGSSAEAPSTATR